MQRAKVPEDSRIDAALVENEVFRGVQNGIRGTDMRDFVSFLPVIVVPYQPRPLVRIPPVAFDGARGNVPIFWRYGILSCGVLLQNPEIHFEIQDTLGAFTELNGVSPSQLVNDLVHSGIAIEEDIVPRVERRFCGTLIRWEAFASPTDVGLRTPGHKVIGHYDAIFSHAPEFPAHGSPHARP
jgi:hypothetical protein